MAKLNIKHAGQPAGEGVSKPDNQVNELHLRDQSPVTSGMNDFARITSSSRLRLPGS
ncbi:hypothetical protein [Pseudomonas asiatica]|uniref:hypothetical protein n=1 Tax=Pseudomonas asiatica TaxID=2219225 RepID=UPI00148503B7|nr:hypothetical protein [Pseudomonas asiatica]